MNRIRRVLAHLLSTFHPVRPLLTGVIGLLRADAGPILVMLVMCILALTAVKEAANYWMDDSVQQLFGPSKDRQQWDVFCKARRDPSAALQSAEVSEEDQAMRLLCLTPLFQRAHQVSQYVSIGDTAKSSAAAIVAVILYLWTSARVASRSTASPGRPVAAMKQSDTVYACLAAATILLAPALAFHIVKIARGLLFGLWTSNSSPDPQAILRESLWAVWFLIAAPFVLPAVPLALTSSRDSVLTEATRLGWNRYLQFAALAAVATGPFIGVAALANWYIRLPVVGFLVLDLHLGNFGRVFFDILVTAVALVAAVVIAAAFIVAVGPPTRDAR
jgi:hypothetical protein